MNDIALIQLEKCVPTLDQFRAPICLPTCKFPRFLTTGSIWRAKWQNLTFLATTQHSAEECCHIHGWGQLASDEAQLKEFLHLDQKLFKEDPNSYTRVFPV